ncbi:MAG: hypothetical protein K0R15_2576 [Clostridiales bacterium]|jgi:flagellar motor switch protein FliG|nr:hypothetical protein [Clostridiales bacterium]
MQLYSFVNSLPNELKTKYYESVIINGSINDILWDEIVDNVKKTYKNISNVEEEIKKVLKTVDAEEKVSLLDLIEKNNKIMYDKLSSQVLNFEDIKNVEYDLVKRVFDKYNTEDIHKAKMAASPQVQELIITLIKERNLENIENIVGSIPITEIESIHNNIINDINELKNNLS